MSQPAEHLAQFVEYVHSLAGDEKGEAHVFCDRLFRAFGHEGYKEAGAVLEARQRRAGESTKYVDLVWRPRLLMEMKSRGEDLHKHYKQAFEYWLYMVPNRPRYVMLCNFDEFWIYDFDAQLDEPMDRVTIDELPSRFTVLNFLFPVEKRPLFGNDRVAVTRTAADSMAKVFNALVRRGKREEDARRFVLQCVFCMFAEDFDLLPRGLFTELVADCAAGASAYDLLGGLFKQMGSSKEAKGGRYRDVKYFDGGLFEIIEPFDLVQHELDLLTGATSHDWSRVQPPVFGTLLQSSLGKEERHAYGAHFTTEADIQKIVLPTIVRPIQERIDSATSLAKMSALRAYLLQFQVLDPACGSGNFLYVAYRELKRLEATIILRIHQDYGRSASRKIGPASLVSTKQFHGIDCLDVAVEIARVGMTLAKEMALAEARHTLDEVGRELHLQFDRPLPLDNLNQNIVCDDALFCDWPRASVIIGNPPFLSKNKAQAERGRAYMNRVRARYPEVPGRADYCVYWFRRAHDELGRGDRAGLVGTNTIRQNFSREGGLDYITATGGAITEAVSTQAWSGEAAVHVSIVNWIKGKAAGKKKLFTQLGDRPDSPWRLDEVERINSSLTASADVSDAQTLRRNGKPKVCLQGQTHGHEGFLLPRAEAEGMIARQSQLREVLFPYLTADDMLTEIGSIPSRYVIDFGSRDINGARVYKDLFTRIQNAVLPDRQSAFEREKGRNQEALEEVAEAKVNLHHERFLSRWWQLSYPRAEMLAAIAAIPRYIACGRVTKRPIFEFIDSAIHPNDAVMVFALADDYSFGILQSQHHWAWFQARCSTLEERPRYTSTTVFDSFPWPQAPSRSEVAAVAEAARDLRRTRREGMLAGGLTLRGLYQTMELPGRNPVKSAQEALDASVREAYGFPDGEDTLASLLALNQELTGEEQSGGAVTGPGIPPEASMARGLTSEDRVRMPLPQP